MESVAVCFCGSQRSFRGGPLQHGELMSERESFCRDFEPRADRSPKRGQQGDEQRSHPARERYQSLSRNRKGYTYGMFSTGSLSRPNSPNCLF